MAVDTTALKGGDISGAVGIGNFNIGAGAVGNILLWILLVVAIVMALCGVIIFIFWKRSYSQKIMIFGLVGNVPTLKMMDRAKIMRFGSAGDTLFFLQKKKKFIAPPTLQAGSKTWWYWERKDGEMINFTIGNIDEQMQQAGAYFVDTDVRMQRLGIEKNLRDRFQKVGFWQKYGATIAGLLFVVLVTVALVVLFAKLVDVANALESTAQAVQNMATAVQQSAKSGGAGISPLTPANST
jgi:hypothetical protein